MALPALLGLGSVLAAVVVPLTVKVFTALGIGFVTYTGVNLALDQAESLIIGSFNSINVANAVSLLAYMNADRAISMILSAIVIRATLKGLQAGGTLRKFSAGA